MHLAFMKINQAQRLAKFNQQLIDGNKVELVDHGVIRSGAQSREMDQTLGEYTRLNCI